MSRRRRLLQGAGIALGVGAAAYGAARWAARRSKRRDDPHADTVFEPLHDSARTIETADGSRLHLIERGSGTPVLMAHGVQNDHRSWFHQIEDLPDYGLRALAFDQRGHGRSTAGEAGFGVGPLADDIHAILDALDLRRAVLVGHSMGGMGVQNFACRFPEVVQERVAGLVLIGTSSHALRLWKSMERIPERIFAGTDLWFDRLMSHAELGHAATRLGLGRRPYGSHVELVRQMLLDCPPLTRQQATRALMDYDVRDLLCDVGVPVLVIGGTLDFLTPISAARRIVDALPNAELRVIPGAGHMPQLEFADEVTQAIAEFARDVAGVESAPAPDAGSFAAG